MTPSAMTMLWAVGAYLALSLLIGYLAHRREREHSPRDYFLGGKLTGPIVLFFTLFSTQYSGNTFFGFTGVAYRSGLIWIMGIPLIMLIIAAYLAYAPRLYLLSKKYDYLTPADFYAHRFASEWLRFLVSALLILALIPYLMIQVTAMGHALSGITGGAISYAMGVIGSSLIILLYVALGGWRAVVWTDVVQGILLTAAIVLAAALAVHSVGGVGALFEQLRSSHPEKLAPPASARTLTASWFSMILVFGLGLSMYPQAVQRIYAARDVKTLKRSLSVMVLAPLIIGPCTLLIGLAGNLRFPHLSGMESDRVMARWVSVLTGDHFAVATLILIGAVAAIMATADSVLLTLASIFTQDVYRPYLRRQATEKELAVIGRLFTAALMIVVVALSLAPGATLWRLTEIKGEYLMQLFPPMVLGLYWSQFNRKGALAGLLAGTGVVASLMLTGHQTWGYFHAGVYGVAANVIACLLATRLFPSTIEEQRRVAHQFFALFGEQGRPVTLAPVAVDSLEEVKPAEEV
ncbi:MAG: sodium:solute symporter family protein [Acidobacteria bacterium]|nr:MAG: sodium:solute symporter family protein [Acidobacteriota bacterium]